MDSTLQDCLFWRNRHAHYSEAYYSYVASDWLPQGGHAHPLDGATAGKSTKTVRDHCALTLCFVVVAITIIFSTD